MPEKSTEKLAGKIINIFLTTYKTSCNINNCMRHAQLAQLVEQRTENPRVSGSIPELGILKEI